jgi:hypothetical protein
VEWQVQHKKRKEEKPSSKKLAPSKTLSQMKMKKKIFPDFKRERE